MTTKIEVSSPVKILQEAKRLIQEVGWVRFSYYIPGQYTHNGKIAGYCLAGALSAADSGEPGNVFTPSYRRVAEAVKRAAGTICITRWNDMTARNKDEVLAVLDKAIAEEMGVPYLP